MKAVQCLKLLTIFTYLVTRCSCNVLWQSSIKDYGQCPFTNAVETGRIKDPELKETSGLVASRKYRDVFYAIQDSLNPDPVYALNPEGDLLGKNDIEQ